MKLILSKTRCSIICYSIVLVNLGIFGNLRLHYQSQADIPTHKQDHLVQLISSGPLLVVLILTYFLHLSYYSLAVQMSHPACANVSFSWLLAVTSMAIAAPIRKKLLFIFINPCKIIYKECRLDGKS